MTADAAGLIIQGASALASVGTGIYNSYQQNKANQQNYKLQKQNYQLQKDTLDWNKANADRDFDYNKQLQERIFQREDSAVQRMVADNRAAGLSPIAGLAGASAGQALEANTPQVSANMSAPQMSANQLLTDFSGFSNLANSLQNYEQHKDAMALSMEKLNMEKSSNELNEQLMKQQIEQNDIKTQIARATMQDEIEGKKLANQNVKQVIAKNTAQTIGAYLDNDLKGLNKIQTKREMDEWLENKENRAKLGELELDSKKLSVDEMKARVLLANLVDEQGENVNARMALTRLSLLSEQAEALKKSNSKIHDFQDALEGIGLDRGKSKFIGSLLNLLTSSPLSDVAGGLFELVH